MRFLKTLFGILSAIFFICSCSSSESEHIEMVEALPMGETIQGKVIPVEADLMNVYDMEILDDRYLVTIEERDHEIFKIFSLPDLEFLYAWGRKGRGPGEFPSMIAPRSIVDASEGQIIIHDPIHRVLKHFVVTDTSMAFIKQTPLSYDMQDMMLNGLQKLYNNVYIALYGMTEKQDVNREFIALEMDNETPLFTFGSYPESELAPHHRAQVYVKSTASKPDGSKFISFYLAYPSFKVYDNNGSLLKEVQIDDSYITNDSNNRTIFFNSSDINAVSEFLDNRIQYRSSVKATDDYLYVLAHNASVKERRMESHRPSIEIWDWDGRPRHRFMLDKNFNSFFTISEKHNKLYALTYSGDETMLFYEYELPEMLDFN